MMIEDKLSQIDDPAFNFHAYLIKTAERTLNKPFNVDVSILNMTFIMVIKWLRKITFH